MSDRFSTISLRQLLSQILKSEEKRSIFGIYHSQFFTPQTDDIFRTEIFGQALETPIGVAAGPHTQMAQNIITAWLCGARYIELKTVQTLDEIEISKPCIDIQDEGYNCEWSQELKIEESFYEYLKAWISIHALRHKFGWSGDPGTIFNMSVGYDMSGILNDNMQWFFDKMADCHAEKQVLIDEIRDLYPKINEIDIPDRISNNITLSTMHGCPPDEIEKIGKCLIEEKGLHTFIKLNPTLLGKAKIHEILKKLGYDTQVPDVAFEHDITYSAAVKVIQSLRKSAEKQGVFLGVKLTNTLEALNHKAIFSDAAMYMSGKALHPISINVARKVRHDFPELPISFCAGVNAFNIADVLACGLNPVTVCSDILKPGGYARLTQYLENIIQPLPEDNRSAIDYLNCYADEVVENPAYRAAWTDIKTPQELTEFDCIATPCVATCPSNQQIPDYMYWTARGDLPKAFETILKTNPFPAVTGMVCDHLCQTKCTRINYDSSLLIREVKRFVAENISFHELHAPEQKNGKKVAIIGAGPSGLSCAYFLILAGFEVDVYETKEFPGGMLADAIPLFRLSESALDEDILRIKNLGVKIHTSQKIDKESFEQIRAKADFVYLAVGAQKALKVAIEGDDVQNGLLDPLKFLSALRQGIKAELGPKVIILGGGNTAVDAARTAKRFVGEDGNVTIVYRRTRREMPADQDEIQAALEEGIELIELAAPAKINSKNGNITSLTCYKMTLGEADKSGRPRPEKIDGSDFDIPADTIIPAFGQERVIDFIDEELLEIQDDNSREIRLPNIFIGGDAYRGASTVISAIADGRKTAETIIRKSGIDRQTLPLQLVDKGRSREELHQKRARIVPGAHPEETPLAERDYFSLVDLTLTEEEAVTEAKRCLYCDQLCDICVTVCPNRANYGYTIAPFEVRLQKAVNVNGEIKIVDDGIFKIEQKYQVLNIADFCNECGNCTTFCPTSGAPYKDKPKVCLTEKSFRETEKGYFLSSDTILFKNGQDKKSLKIKENEYHYESDEVFARIRKSDLKIVEAKFKKYSISEVSFFDAVKMSVIFFCIKRFVILT
ncbi:MAG: putative selenate reductase subunit YgfK [Candidatus Marinimicrobia bacterium]|nr:putative selenate reductase subunit YgfK [Candidatus Neomarinimicrobiota bacterium]